MTEHIISLIGAPGAGKSAVTIQFICGHWLFSEYDPTIEDSYRKQIGIDGETCLIDILDTAEGEEEFVHISAFKETYYTTSQGFIAMFSVTSRLSFLQMQTHIDRATVVRSLRMKEGFGYGIPFPILIVGNQMDDIDHREVSKEEALAFAKSYQANYIETSAKNNINIHEIFFEMVREIRVASRKPSEYWPGRYRASATFYGDTSAGLDDLLSELAGKRIEMPSSQSKHGSDIIIVPSQRYSKLNYHVWAADPTTRDHIISEPAFFLFMCFSVVNRSSFEKIQEKWKKLPSKIKYPVITFLVGTRSDLRGWVDPGNKKKVESKQNVEPDTNAYQPFSHLPEGMDGRKCKLTQTEIVVHIFSYLPMLENVIFTCKRFAKIAQHPSLRFIKSGMIQLPAVTREEAEDLVKQMNGVKYIECSARYKTGLEELFLDDVFEKYMKEDQDEYIQYVIDNIQPNGSFKKPSKKKKKKKRFWFF